MDVKSCWRFACLLVLLLPILLAIPMLIHRGLRGEYGLDFEGFGILAIGIMPFICVFLLRNRVPTGYRVNSTCGLSILATFASIGMILYYLSSNGLWCAQHPSVTREMCAKLNQFASFASSVNLRFWWLTLGDLLAIQRGLTMPMAWEHDIDICVTPEEFLRFEKALATHAGYFEPKPFHYEKGHWYIPIDMAKLGLRPREAEGVNIDIWTCPKSFKGNITRVLYCNGYMNVPGSAADRHKLLTKEYGDYSEVKYEHHNGMCKLWRG